MYGAVWMNWLEEQEMADRARKAREREQAEADKIVDAIPEHLVGRVGDTIDRRFGYGRDAVLPPGEHGTEWLQRGKLG